MDDEVREIRFYRPGDEFGELSNFAAYPVTLYGKVWPTSEHYFQAQKFGGDEARGRGAPGEHARSSGAHRA